MNELQTLNQNTQAEVVQTADGKFKRKAVYHAVNTVKVETKEDKIRVVNIINGNDPSVKEMKNSIGADIVLTDIITNPYTSVDEDTGEITEGVTTMLFSEDGSIYVTSSKTVYFTLNNIFKIFAMPGSENYETLQFKIIKKPGRKHEVIDVQLLG